VRGAQSVTRRRLGLPLFGAKPILEPIALGERAQRVPASRHRLEAQSPTELRLRIDRSETCSHSARIAESTGVERAAAARVGGIHRERSQVRALTLCPQLELGGAGRGEATQKVASV